MTLEITKSGSSLTSLAEKISPFFAKKSNLHQIDIGESKYYFDEKFKEEMNSWIYAPQKDLKEKSIH